MTNLIGETSLEGKILRRLESVEKARAEELVEALAADGFDQAEISRAIRRLLARDCIVLTRDWRLQHLPGHQPGH